MSRLSEVLNSYTPLGWQEWVSFPEWDINFIKAKVDTGAKTSSLHAEDISIFSKDGKDWVEFTIYPWQKNNSDAKSISAELIGFRKVRSSSGSQEKRPVVMTGISVAGISFETEITLTNRELMGFRMLLGRKALDRRFAVITSRSHLGIKAPSEIRQLNSGGNRK